MTVIQLKVVDARVTLPAYATDASAGLDLRACLDVPCKLAPGEVVLISTGIAIHIENPLLAGMVLPRSGLGHNHGIVLGNLTGLIDADYQGEIKISCWNRGNDHFTIQPFDRIAQLVIVPIVRAKFETVSEFLPTLRGENGFGHTGKD